ncbi:unnamed protein product [Ilex paraguariensis]|uniref:Uncharacterized protein n=1 Tax=Ilex paraguariensis TaxID=185542 RepID=A0ABC8R2F6_9AQUA
MEREIEKDNNNTGEGLTGYWIRRKKGGGLDWNYVSAASVLRVLALKRPLDSLCKSEQALRREQEEGGGDGGEGGGGSYNRLETLEVGLASPWSTFSKGVTGDRR